MINMIRHKLGSLSHYLLRCTCSISPPDLINVCFFATAGDQYIWFLYGCESDMHYMSVDNQTSSLRG